MHRKQNVVIAYLAYPICFLLLACLLWLTAGEAIYRYVDAKIVMHIINNVPDNLNTEDPLVLGVKEGLSMADIESIDPTSEGLATGEEQELAYGTQYGTIRCEERELEAPLYYGDDDDLLRLGAGQYTNSVTPGSTGVSIIGGHDTTFFAPLEKVQVGDEIQIQTTYGLFVYEVQAMHVAHIMDTNAYELEDPKETVILYTCYPFGQIQEEREFRYYVYCTRTN